ncbi:hypothetical protein P7L78_13590 [Tistrella bauzanensis]|jgi:hypothetical protein|uniref:DUF6898 domain-containing protein n=1 Tax=Tistrella arctica TaxID=3133430 RepID=A0ABU9YHS8_9PROT
MTTPPDDILLEITAAGVSLRVAAIDAATGEEVTFIAPHGTAEAALARLARDKLAYVRARRARAAPTPAAEPRAVPGRKGGRSIIA